MSTRGFDPGRDETGEKFVNLNPDNDGGNDSLLTVEGEPDTKDDEFARADAPDQEFDVEEP